MEIVFLGINDVGMEIYEWLCDRNEVSVAALVTTKEQLDLVPQLDPNLVVSVGYDYRVPDRILSIPSRGCLNLHPSYLPYNRGKSPNVWSIVDGTPAGVTLHYMDEEFDTGDIVARRKVDIDFSDTGKDLHNRLERAQFQLFTETWPSIENGEVDATAQSKEAGTYHSTSDFMELCELDPTEEVTIREFLDRLRALTFPPFDNAKVEIEGRTYYIDVDIRSESRDDEPEDSLLSSY